MYLLPKIQQTKKVKFRFQCILDALKPFDWATEEHTSQKTF